MGPRNDDDAGKATMSVGRMRDSGKALKNWDLNQEYIFN